MQKFKHDCQRGIMVSLVSAEPCRKDHQQWSQALAATSHDMTANGGDEGDAGGKITVYFRFNPIQIRPDATVDSLFKVSLMLREEPGGNR